MRTYKIHPSDRQKLVDSLNAGENRSLKVSDLPLMGGEKCPNCSDQRFIRFEVVKNRGYRTVFVESFIFPCGVCYDHSAYVMGMLDKTNIDRDDRNYHIDYYNGMSDKENVYKWGVNILSGLSSANGFVLFRGDYGRGKTGLAKSLVLRMAEMGIYSHYITAKYLLLEITSAYSNKHISELDIVRQFSEYKFLVIDEVDIVQDTQFSLTTLRTLIDTRYSLRDSKLTIMITNQMTNFWPYLFSRLRDGEIVEFDGCDLRGLS